MKEIKIVIGKNGKVKILANGPGGAGTEQFTEKLAKELGDIEERHKGNQYNQNQQGQQIRQGQGGH